MLTSLIIYTHPPPPSLLSFRVCVCLVFLSPLLPILHSLRGLSNLFSLSSLLPFLLGFIRVALVFIFAFYRVCDVYTTSSLRGGERKLKVYYECACVSRRHVELALSLPPNPCGFESAPHRFFSPSIIDPIPILVFCVHVDSADECHVIE